MQTLFVAVARHFQLKIILIYKHDSFFIKMAPPKVYKVDGENKYYLPIKEEVFDENDFYVMGMCIHLHDDGSISVYSGGVSSRKITRDFDIPDALESLIPEISESIREMKEQGKTYNEITDAISLMYPRLRF